MRGGQDVAWGVDLRDNFQPAFDYAGWYATDLFTDRAVGVISAHNQSQQPLFLYLAHLAVHVGNPFAPLQVTEERYERFANLSQYDGRRRYAAMVAALDDGVGRVMEALRVHGLADNSIVIFTADNGGAPGGYHQNYGSNWPLRGGKFSLFEGGTSHSIIPVYPPIPSCYQTP